MFGEKMNERSEEDMGDKLNVDQPGNSILGPSNANTNSMTQLQESIAEESWAARGNS